MLMMADAAAPLKLPDAVVLFRCQVPRLWQEAELPRYGRLIDLDLVAESCPRGDVQLP